MSQSSSVVALRGPCCRIRTVEEAPEGERSTIAAPAKLARPRDFPGIPAPSPSIISCSYRLLSFRLYKGVGFRCFRRLPGACLLPSQSLPFGLNGPVYQPLIGRPAHPCGLFRQWLLQPRPDLLNPV